MRRYHRWLAVFFAPFLMWIAGTGLTMQLKPVWLKVFGGAHPAGPATPQGTPPGFRCPPTMICFPKPDKSGGPGLDSLHSGSVLGPAGRLLSILSGCSLLFFAFSGAWMYLRMWRDRRRRAIAPRWFW